VPINESGLFSNVEGDAMIHSLISRAKKVAYAKHLYQKNGKPLDHPRFPLTVHIECTNNCPARCVMCPMDIMTRSTGAMEFELFERLVREVARYPEVEELHMHGFGEPTLDKQLPRKVALAKKLGIQYTYIVTTGSLLTKETAKSLIIAGLDGMKFSFYGMTAQTYEATHRRLKFDKVVRNIETFFDVRDQLKASNPQIRFQFAREVAPPGEFEAFINHWRPYMDADRGDAFFDTGLHNWGGAKAYNEQRNHNDIPRCRWPFRDMQILWDGKVVPCCYDYDANVVLGNVREKTIEEIWFSKEYENFRQIWRNSKAASIPICAKCDEPYGFFQAHEIERPLQPVARQVLSRRGMLTKKIGRSVGMLARTARVSLGARAQ
jgi:radical SAM protein with 4Fe4S-binding SPASM domain